MAVAKQSVRKPVRASPPAARVSPRGAARTADRILDARPDRLDLRDLPYRPPLRSLPPTFPDDATIRTFLPEYVRAGLVLDQGREGACTGFGLACVVNYLLFARHRGEGRFSGVSPRMLYELAKRYDEWPGNDYEGSSCRGALKGWHKHGVCSEALWPYPLDAKGMPVPTRPLGGWEADAGTRPLGVYYRVQRDSVVDLQAAIVEIGAVYVSGNVHDGWDHLAQQPSGSLPASHATLPVIGTLEKRDSLGGHSFALVGYNDRGFVVQNSWGTGWGLAGFAVLPYDDWVEHGTDAWACALGVPVTLGATPLVATRWRVPSGRSLTTIERARRSPANPPHDPWPVDHDFLHKPYEPWSTPAAYEHALVSGNDGELCVADITRPRGEAAQYAKEIVHDRPLAWLRQQAAGKVARVVLYAHGGLNGEDESIRRIRVLGPYFEANGVYPLFLTWKTGVGETLADIVQDWSRKVGWGEARAAGILSDAFDRAIEALAHVLGRGIWTEMRENAAASVLAGHALDLVARNLASLAAALQSDNRRIELHLVGHSAGSILLGHLLARMGQGALRSSSPTITSATLFAAACSTRFAVETYLGAVQNGLLKASDIHCHVLSDGNEKADGLPTPEVAAYGKSLLYLVSRALDDQRKMPLLGMERALDRAYANDADQWAAGELASVQQWQAAWTGPKTIVTASHVRNTRAGGQVQATHGAFDNDIEGLTAVIERIAGKKIPPMEWLDY